MDVNVLKKYIKFKNFLPEFCGIEFTPMILHKMRGIDGHGNEIAFTKEEKEKIKRGLEKMSKKLK